MHLGFVFGKHVVVSETGFQCMHNAPQTGLAGFLILGKGRELNLTSVYLATEKPHSLGCDLGSQRIHEQHSAYNTSMGAVCSENRQLLEKDEPKSISSRFYNFQ